MLQIQRDSSDMDEEFCDIVEKTPANLWPSWKIYQERIFVLVYVWTTAVIFIGLSYERPYLVLDPNLIMICILLSVCKLADYTCKPADYSVKLVDYSVIQWITHVNWWITCVIQWITLEN